MYSNKSYSPAPAVASEPWDQVTIPAEHATAGRVYPFAQWWNGQKAFQRMHPVLGLGGWAIPVEQIAGLMSGDLAWSAGELPHRDGTSTPAYLVPELYLAVLATRFSWVIREARGVTVLSEYQPGARGKLQALCAVRGLDLPMPLMATLSGLAGQHFSQTLRAFRQQIIAPASGLARRAFPLYAFWMPVKAGPVVQVGPAGKQSPITPPSPGWDQAGLKNPEQRAAMLRALFVGQKVIDFCAGQWDEAQQWAQTAKAPDVGLAPAPEPIGSGTSEWSSSEVYQEPDDEAILF